MQRGRSRPGARRAALWIALLGLALGPSAAAAAGLASPEVLASLADAARQKGSGSTEAALVSRMLEAARADWRWGSVSGEFVTSGPRSDKTCHPKSDSRLTEYLKEGASDAYAQVLGAHLASDDALAARARSHVLDLLDTHGFSGLDGDFGGSNQCILELAISIPIWIETAKLLEGTPGWRATDRVAFQAWLASQVYPRVAWASRTRSNNWGAAGSLAAWAIADYVDGTVLLDELQPARLALLAPAAAAAHLGMQRARMAGDFRGDASCAQLGIQPDGGIPEELRRGSTGCAGRFLAADDSSLAYQTMHVELLVLHAELARRSGDTSLYAQRLASGAPAILQAIRFVIANGAPGGRSWPWPEARLGTLIVAASYYDDGRLAAEAGRDGSFRGGRTLPYARVTHGDFAREAEEVARQPGEAAPPEIGKPGQPRPALD